MAFSLTDPVSLLWIIAALVGVVVYKKLSHRQGRTAHEAEDEDFGKQVALVHDNGSLEIFESIKYNERTGERTIITPTGDVAVTYRWPPQALAMNAGESTGDPETSMLYTVVDPFDDKTYEPFGFQSIRAQARNLQLSFENTIASSRLEQATTQPGEMWKGLAKLYGEAGRLAQGRMSGSSGFDFMGGWSGGGGGYAGSRYRKPYGGSGDDGGGEDFGS